MAVPRGTVHRAKKQKEAFIDPAALAWCLSFYSHGTELEANRDLGLRIFSSILGLQLKESYNSEIDSMELRAICGQICCFFQRLERLRLLKH